MSALKKTTPVAACPRCGKSGTWMVYTSQMNTSDHFSCAACGQIWTVDKRPPAPRQPKETG